jgi:hypothetical protein
MRLKALRRILPPNRPATTLPGRAEGARGLPWHDLFLLAPQPSFIFDPFTLADDRSFYNGVCVPLDIVCLKRKCACWQACVVKKPWESHRVRC